MPTSHRNWVNSLAQHPRLLLNYPLQAYRPSLDTVSVKTLQRVPPNCNVLLLSAGQSFTSREYVGASASEAHQIREAFLKARQDYELFESEEVRSLYSILLQLYANSMEIDEGVMPLYSFANAVLLQADNIPAFNVEKYASKIRSPHLLGILRANEGMVSKLFELLTHFVKTSNPEEFARTLRTVRSQIRRVAQ